jgi:PAS domain S-box-containing protein
MRALEDSASIIVVTNSKGIIQYVNRTFEKKYGYTKDEIIGQNPRVLNSGYHDQVFYEDLWQTILSGTTWKGTFRNYSKKGDVIWEKATISPIHSESAELEGFISIKEDVTKQVELENQLKEDHLFLEELFNNAPVGIIILKPLMEADRIKDIIVLKANPNACKIVNKLGLVGLSLNSFMPDVVFSNDRFKIMMKRKYSFETLMPNLNKYLSIRSFPFGEDMICTFFYDVTAYKHTITALEASEERYFSLVEDAPAMICRFNTDGRLTYANSQYIHSLGLNNELGEHTYLEHLSEDDQRSLVNQIEQLNTDQPVVEMEYQVVIDDDVRWYRLYYRALFGPDGKVTEYQSVGMDFTEIKNMELQMLEKEKQLTELNLTKDKLFSIIAHDIKNPFNVILGFASILSENFNDLSREDIRSYIEKVLHASENVYKLLDDLLIWARSQMGQMKVKPQFIQPHDIISQAFHHFQNLAAQKNIQLINHIPTEVTAFADYEMIRFVVRNLIHNGIKFTPENGRVECRGNLTENGCVIQISDSGIGIKAAKLEKLFTISGFIETSGTNEEKGTGLGLHLAREMIIKNKGSIQVDSVPTQGTTFTIHLPID